MISMVNTPLSTLDRVVVDVLKCKDLSAGFDFFNYGRLAQTVLERLIRQVDLEDLVESGSSRGALVEPTQPDAVKKHQLCYEQRGSLLYMMADVYNAHNPDNNLDMKLITRDEMQSRSGRHYLGTLVALEIYREKGDGRPVWVLGFYVNEKGNSNLIYGEHVVILLPSSEDRNYMLRQAPMFAHSIKDFRFEPGLEAFYTRPRRFRYLNQLLKSNQGFKVIKPKIFRENALKWFRYHVGELDIQANIKFEDRSNRKGIIKYRVELLNEGDRYSVLLIEGDKPIQNGPFPKADGPFCFIESATHYLDMITKHVGKKPGQFAVAYNPQRIDLRFAAALKDKKGYPLIVSSWESPSHSSSPPHYIQIWGNSDTPLRFDQESHFPGYVPRDFMEIFLKAINNVEYTHSMQLIDTVKKYDPSIPLRNPDA